MDHNKKSLIWYALGERKREEEREEERGRERKRGRKRERGRPLS